MSSIKYFLTEHSSFTQVLIYALIFVSIWIAEMLISLNGLKSKWQHSRLNFMFILTALPVQLALAGIVLSISAWDVKHSWGLVYWIPYHSNPIVYYVSLFLLLDFCEYAYHVIMHKIGPFWKFHLIHHTDSSVDVSTTVREHPGETALRMCFLMLWVMICGAPAGLLLVRQTIQSISNIASHSTFRLPTNVNKWLGKIFITPNLHQVHHHFQLPYTNCNYGDILSIWDRMFGTFSDMDKESTVFGLDTHGNESINNNFKSIIRTPFQST